MAKVLVAEDERGIRELLVDILFDAGFDVIEAENGAIAVEKAGQEFPDVILLDIWMPTMDGFQVLHKLREDPETESTPVVLLTAMSPIKGEQEGMRLGALHYITKSWSPGIITATIRIALREAQYASAPKDEESVVWAGSTSYSRPPDGGQSRMFIQTDDPLSLLGKKLGGGIAVNSLTLIEGAAAAGKSVLCQHLANGALMDSRSVVYFTSEHSPGSLTRQMESLGLAVSQYLQNDRLSILPVEEPAPQEDSGPLLAALALDLERLPKKYELIVLDSVTQLANYTDGPAVVGFFSSLRRQCARGRAIIVVAHSHVLDDGMVARLSAVCDAHLRLRTGKVRSKVVRIAEVIKANNVELDGDNLINFEVEAGTGVNIIPFSRVKA